MESTLKIDISSRTEPVIKVVQPIKFTKNKPKSRQFDDLTDYDVKDKLISDFLHVPDYENENTLFEVGGLYPLPDSENSTHQVTIINPIKYDEVLYKIRHIVLNRVVPYDTILQYNKQVNQNGYKFVKENYALNSDLPKGDWYIKINDFFDEVEKNEKIPKNFNLL